MARRFSEEAFTRAQARSIQRSARARKLLTNKALAQRHGVSVSFVKFIIANAWVPRA